MVLASAVAGTAVAVATVANSLNGKYLSSFTVKRILKSYGLVLYL